WFAFPVLNRQPERGPSEADFPRHGIHFRRAFGLRKTLKFVMTIWILAILLLASVVGLGWRQGAIRVAFSFAGILVGALLAAPLGPLIRPGFAAFGVKNPAVLWLVPPVVIFILIGIIFKVAAFFVHQKVEVYYKYKAGDLRLSLWQRLNHRMG